MQPQDTKASTAGQSAGSFAEQLAARQRAKPQLGSRVARGPSPSQTRADNVVSLRVDEGLAAHDEPIDFLKILDPTGWHNLVAIDPDKRAPLEGRTFVPGAWAEMSAWIAARNGTKNLYFSVNEPAPGAPNTKLDKREIASVRAVHVDIDPAHLDSADPAALRAHVEAERQRLRDVAGQLTSGPVPPSLVLDSGGGIQALWLLAEKVDARTSQPEVEAQNLGLAVVLEGDRPARDISRILRLPGTMNLPDTGKRAKGRTERRASVLHHSGGRYALDKVAVFYPPEFESARADRSPEIARLMDDLDLGYITQASDYGRLPGDLRSKFEAALLGDPALDAFWRTGRPNGDDPSSSAARFELARRLKALSFTSDEFGALLSVWGHAVGAGRPTLVEWGEYDIRRDIARCWVNSPDAIDSLDWFEEVDPAPDGASGTGADLPKAPLVTFADAVASALQQSAKPLVKGLLDQGALSVLYGESNVGKTFVAMDIAYHVATGLAWAERRTAHSGVVYVAAEGGHGARRRAKALANRYGDAATREAKFRFWLGGVNLLRSDTDLTTLTAEVRALGDVGLIVIDTLSRALAGGDENASTDMGALVKNVDRLRHSTGAHVMLVHHSGKDRARGARGHSLLRAATDTEIEVADNAIMVTKQRDLDGNFRRGFVLEPVQLGVDADGDAITSCTVRLAHAGARPVAQPTPAEEEVLAALRRLHRVEGPGAVFKPQRISDECTTGVKAEAVRTRLRTLEGKHLVERSGDGLWRVKPDSLSGGFDPVTRYFDDGVTE